MKKLLVRLGITVSIPIITLIAFILFPGISYSKKIQIENVSVYYNTHLDESAQDLVKQSLEIVKTSELFDARFKIDLCLDDDSNYAYLINKLKGPAFGFGIGNKVILKCHANFKTNQAVGYGEAWDLKELTHELIHTYQYHKYGLGTLKTPTWKLEGYAEYISRSKSKLNSLHESIDFMLIEREKAGGSDWVWIKLEDGTGFPSQYLVDKILIQYLMEIEQLSYTQIKKDERLREAVEEQALNWFRKIAS